MKYLKYLLGFIVLLVVIFICLGLFMPSQSYSSEVTVDKSVEEAWAVMNDERKISQWLKDITKVEHVSGEKGTAGAVTKYTFNQDGTESIVTETMKEIRPNEHVSMDFVMEGAMTMNYQMDFSEKDGKTHIKSSTIAKGDGLIMKSMLNLMTGTMKSQEDENLGNLKKLIEENTTDYFPVTDVVVEEVDEAN